MQKSKSSTGLTKSRPQTLQASGKPRKKTSWTIQDLEEKGYQFISRGDWRKGLERHLQAPFFISSFSKLLIVPPRFTYPHLSLSIAGTLFSDTSYMAIRPDSIHYSPSSDGRRCAFYPYNSSCYRAEYPIETSTLKTVREWLKQAKLPFTLMNHEAAQESTLDKITSEVLSSEDESDADGLDSLAVSCSLESAPSRKAQLRRAKKRKSKHAKGKKVKEGHSKKSARPKKPSASCTAQEQITRLFTQDYTQEWIKILGPDFVQEAEMCELGEMGQYAEVKPEDSYFQTFKEYHHLSTAVMDERHESVCQALSAMKAYEERYKILASSLGRNARKVEMTREFLRKHLENSQACTSLFVTYGDRIANRQQFSLMFINPESLPTVCKLLSTGVKTELESTLQQGSVKASSATEPSAQHIRKVCFMNLRLLSSALHNLHIAAYNRESYIFLESVHTALDRVFKTREERDCFSGLFYVLQNVEAAVVKEYNQSELPARESYKGWYDFCKNVEGQEDKWRRLNSLSTELFSLCFDLLKLLAEADRDLYRVVLPVYQQVSRELSAKFIQLCGKLRESATRKMKVVSATCTLEEANADAEDVLGGVDLMGLDSLDSAEELMEIVRNLHSAVRQYVRPA